MSAAVDTALSQLTNIKQSFQSGFYNSGEALQAIKNLASTLSAAASGPGGVIYSGEIGGIHSSKFAQQIAQETGKSILDNTDRALFIKDQVLKNTLATIYAESGVAADAVLGKVNTFIAGGQDLLSLQSSLWGQASKDFAKSLTGEITVVATEANLFKHLILIEIPEILAQGTATSLGGKSLSTFVGLTDTALKTAVQEQFVGLVSSGGVFASKLAGVETAAITKQAYAALGHVVETAPDAGRLLSLGFEQVVSHAPTILKNVLMVGGLHVIKFLGTGPGGALLDVLLSAEPANAGELDLQAQMSNIRSDLPEGMLPDSITIGQDGKAAIKLSLLEFGQNPAIDIFLTATGESAGASGFIQNMTAVSEDGTRVDAAFAPNGNRLVTTTDAANTAAWNRVIESFIANVNGPVNEIGKVVINDNEQVASVTYNGVELAGNFGAMFGSKLGNYLGGSNPFAKLAAGTVLGTIGSEVAKALAMGANYSLALSVENAFGSLAGGSGVGSLPSGAISSVSSLLMSELAKEMHLGGLAGSLVQAVGATVTTQLITNAYGVMTGATYSLPGGGSAPYTMFTGFDPATIAGNLGPSVGLQLSGAVGGVLGSTLAAHIMVPQHQEGAIGQQIGSSVGGMVGAFLLAPIPIVGPFLGSFMGSFLGSVVGSFAGDLAGNDPESHGVLEFNTTSHRFEPVGSSFWGDHGATGYTFRDIATYTALTTNALADFAGVNMRGWTGVTRVDEMELGPRLQYLQDDHDFILTEDTSGILVWEHNVVSNESERLAPLTNTGIMTLVHKINVQGGDPLVRYAWTHSAADNPSAFALDLQIAKDYRAYLDDKDMIDLMMAAAPESAFTAGWIVTLLKAHDLGLDTQPSNDDFRNGNDNVGGTEAGDLLIGGAGHDVMNGYGGNDRMRGDAGSEQMRGGAGDDILIGGADFDTAHFSGSRWSYTLTDLGDGVVSVVGPDGSDTLVQMEKLQFDDMAVDLPLTRDLSVGWSLQNGVAAFDVWNTGSMSAGASAAGLYLSTDTTLTTSDIFVSSTAIPALGPNGFSQQRVPVAFPGNLTPGHYWLGVIADHTNQVAETNESNNASYLIGVNLGNDSANTIITDAGNNIIFGLGGNDSINGSTGADLITGGTGADRYVVDHPSWFDAVNGIIDRVTDYNRSGGAFNGAEGDQIDLSQILWQTYGNLPPNDVVRALAYGPGVKIQVDGDGTANGANWTTVLQLDDVQYGSAWINIFLHGNQPLGTTIPILPQIDQPLPSLTDLTASWSLTRSTANIDIYNGSSLPAAATTAGIYVSTDTNFTPSDTLIASVATAALNPGAHDRRSVALTFPGNLTPGTYYVGVLADKNEQLGEGSESNNGSNAIAVMLGNDSANTITGDDGNNIIFGLAGNDLINGYKGIDTLTGGAGADKFWIHLDAYYQGVSTGWHDRITDFNQSSGSFNSSEGDMIDLSMMLWSTYGNVATDTIVRALPVGTDAIVQMHGGEGWQTVARLEGVHAGNVINVYIHPAQPGGAPITVQGPERHSFDGDPRGDLIWQRNDGMTGVWLMNGTTVSSISGALPGTDAAWRAKESADFNGDGKADILWQSNSGPAGIWLMNGTSVAQVGGALPDPGAGWHVQDAADFNGDGKADILWDHDNGTAGVWLMNGTSLQSPSGALASAGWHAKAADDFDGDGKADILWQHDNGTVGVWLMDGNGVAQVGGGIAMSGSTWRVKDASDFNGDGKADILFQNDNGAPAVWLMDGTNVISMGPALTNPGTAWHVKSATDYDGDGKADILWQHDDGTAAVWLMNGTSLVATGAPLPNPGPEWQVI